MNSLYHSTLSLLLSVLILFFGTTLLSGQEEKESPSLLDSAKLGGDDVFEEDNSDGKTSATKAYDANRKYFQGINIPGLAAKYGMHYFPRSFDVITYVNMKTLDEDGGFKNAVAGQQGLTQLEELLKTDRNEMESIVRGQFARFSISAASFPSLMVVRCRNRFPVSEITGAKGIKELKANGKTYYRSSDGITFAFPDPNFAVIGTTNEVAYALHKDPSDKLYPGFEWVDLSNYDTGLFRVWRQGVLTTDTKVPVATFVKGNALTESVVQVSEQAAEYMAKNANARFYLFMRAENPKKFIMDNPDSFPNFGTKLFEKREENVDRYLEKTFEQEKKSYVASTVNAEFEYQNNKNVYSVTTKYSKPGSHLWYSNYYNLALCLDGFAYRNSHQSAENSRQRALKNLQSFEMYKFDSNSARDSLESSLESNVNVSNVNSLMSPLVDSPTPLYSTILCLENTSSMSVRNRAIKELADTFSRRAVVALGKEAHRFDLQGNTWISRIDDAPNQKEINRNVNKIDFDNLIEHCRYYLQTANGADPILTVACCRIIEDLRALSALDDLKAFSGRADVSEREKVAALRAIRSIENPSYTPPNSLPNVKDIETAKSWLRNIDRAKRSAALVWVARASTLGESKANIVESLMYLLDDATLQREAMLVAKKICDQSDLPAIRAILKNAAEGPDSGFRMRQHYSLYRVVDLLAHLNDSEGIELAIDNDLEEDDRSRSRNRDFPSLKEYAQKALDQLPQNE